MKLYVVKAYNRHNIDESETIAYFCKEKNAVALKDALNRNNDNWFYGISEIHTCDE